MSSSTFSEPLLVINRSRMFDDSGSVDSNEAFFDGMMDNLGVQAREPEQQLWRAVVAQAVLDAVRPVRDSVPRSQTAKALWMARERAAQAAAERDEAIDWLTSENEDAQSFNWVALHVFDIEPKVLRERIATATPALQEVIL